MSDWKESANKRRDFRSGKFEPEVPKHKKKGKNKKPWKIICFGNMFFGKDKEWVLGRYKTEKSAKDAMASFKQNFWSKYDLRIEKDN